MQRSVFSRGAPRGDIVTESRDRDARTFVSESWDGDSTLELRHSIGGWKLGWNDGPSKTDDAARGTINRIGYWDVCAIAVVDLSP